MNYKEFESFKLYNEKVEGSRPITALEESELKKLSDWKKHDSFLYRTPETKLRSIIEQSDVTLVLRNKDNNHAIKKQVFDKPHIIIKS